MVNNLKLMRIWKGMTQTELADKAGCSATTVSIHERNKRLMPIYPKLLSSFSKALGVDPKMITEEVVLLPKSWSRLLTDARLSFLVEEILTWDAERVEKSIARLKK